MLYLLLCGTSYISAHADAPIRLDLQFVEAKLCFHLRKSYSCCIITERHSALRRRDAQEQERSFTCPSPDVLIVLFVPAMLIEGFNEAWRLGAWRLSTAIGCSLPTACLAEAGNYTGHCPVHASSNVYKSSQPSIHAIELISTSALLLCGTLGRPKAQRRRHAGCLENA